ncbi:hypothetical protein [Pseudazoarcus pumilus]|uniref:Uncharacterized protein n=1 Tax=Pseudazoarcus pumilus TaxID=2067960 RepID=A0A2I6S439_9RHOO|nr:hypothetical protein [Pseudazoarcus pumilus]AUN94029.1 hypothetical protein C0099_03145 [Pseudazoarcus pumilus]
MSDEYNEAEQRFLERIERRVEFFRTLFMAELGVYLPSDETQRKRAIGTLVRMTARQKELPHLSPDVLEQAKRTLSQQLEAMQKLLPHDVQYRNRLRRPW